MRRPSEMEHSELLALSDHVVLHDGDVARGHLRHPDSDEAHQANGRVVCLDEDQGPSGQRRDECLGPVLRFGVRTLGIGESHAGRLGVVHTGNRYDLLDDAIDGTVPTMVVERTEERLIDGPSDKVRREGVVVEHVVERVRLALHVEFVESLDVGGDFINGRFAGRVDDRVVIGDNDWTHTVSEASCKKVVPRREPVVWLRGVAEVRLDEIRHSGGRSGTEPTVVIGSEDVARGRRSEEACPDIKHLLELRIDHRIEECRESCSRTHRPVENGVHGDSSETIDFEGWCLGDDLVEQRKHRLVIPDLLT